MDSSFPRQLRPVESRNLPFIDHAIELIKEGKTVVVAGLSLLGDEGWPVVTVSISRGEHFGDHEKAQWFGWCKSDNPNSDEWKKFFYFGSNKPPAPVPPLPNIMTFFLAETDAKLAEEDANQEEVAEILDFLIAWSYTIGPS